MTLKSANQLHEVDTQGTVSDVINRLPTYCREEWTKRAMMYRREHSKYPGYEELITYVEEASADANDPVYAWAPAGGGQEGALAPPWKFTDMGGPPKDNLTRNFKKKIKGTPYSKRRN